MPDLIQREAPSGESIWKRLTRLFRSGPVVRHKIAGGEKLTEPQGTARAYKKELSSLYVNSLASYGQYERLCVGLATTTISVPSKQGFITLQELITRYPNGERFLVYAYDSIKRKIVPAWAHHPRSSGFRDTVKVTFDDGKTLVCTPDHPCMLRDGTYVDAGKLQPGQSMMPFYRKQFNGTRDDGKTFSGYRSIYTMEKQPKSWRGWEPEHRLIAEWAAARDVIPRQEHVHHLDHDPENNLPENLEIKDAHQHLAEHGKHAIDQWADPTIREKMLEGIQSAWDNDDGSRRAIIAKANREKKTRKDVTFDQIVKLSPTVDHDIKKLSAVIGCSVNVIFKRIRWAGFQTGMSWCSFVEQKFGVTLPNSGNGKRSMGHFLPVLKTERFTQQLPVNHKVVSVEPNGVVEVGDLTVDGHENFATDSIFVHNSRYADYCLAGDTHVLTTEGQVKISEIVERFASGAEIYVYAFDREACRTEIVKISDAKNKGSERLWEVRLSSGFTVRCNSVHPFMLADREYTSAERLRAGDLLVPGIGGLVEQRVVSVRETDERADVFDITVPGLHDFAICDEKAQNIVYSRNSEMEFTPEIASAIDIYADEVTAKDDEGEVVKIVSKDSEIKQVLETLFYDIVNVEFNLWSWVRNLTKYGDFVLFVDASEQNGILNLLPIPINEIERDEGYDKKDPFAVRFRWASQGNMVLENWQIIHIRLLGNDNFLPYGSSIIEPARRIWRQLILIEDAMLVYRIVRSPERRVFKIDVGNVPPDQIDQYMEEVKLKLRRNQVVDPNSGRVDLRYNPLPVRRDTQVPLLDGRTLTIEELAREHEAGKENWVYSVQDGTKKLVPGKVSWCGKNYVCDRIHRVWLDDGGHVDTAPEHPFVMRDGSARRADELAAGDSLMPLYKKLSSKEDGDLLKGYEKCLDPSSGEYVYTHKFVADDKYHSAGGYSVRARRVIHHVDYNKRNNGPKNLQEMSYSAHRAHHAAHAEMTLNTPEQLEARRVTRIAYNKSPEKRAKTAEQNKLYQKAEKMGTAYNGSELHKSHNLARKVAQEESWSKDKEARSDAMRWIVPNEVMKIVFDRVKQEPDIPRGKLWGFVKEDPTIRTLVTEANRDVNKRDPAKFHCTAVQGKLERMGELPTEAGFVAFREYAASHEAPVNYQVTRVEILDGVSDDVYCMTVVGSQGEEDRHNFAIKCAGSDLESYLFIKNSVDEDYFLPVRGDRSSDISTLAGGQMVGDIDDVQYIQSKMFAALKIPKAYLGYEGDLGSKATLAQQDVRFARTIERVQKLVVSELNKIAIIHLFLLGYSGSDLVNFEIKLAASSTIAEQQKLELWRMRFEVASLAQEGIFDRETIQRKIFNLSDEEIERIRNGKRIDKLEDLTIEAMQAPGQEGEEPLPGEEGLPSTLGGEEGGEKPPEGAPPEGGGASTQPEGVEHGPVLESPSDGVDEKKNMGSTGNRAEIAVDKGKDLFSPSQDLFSTVFGTKKQAASDPNDMRAQRRLITRPFSEASAAGIAEQLQLRQARELAENEEMLDGADRLVESLSAFPTGLASLGDRD